MHRQGRNERWRAASSLKACCYTNCDYQLWFPPSICFNLFKHTDAHLILIKIDEVAWNQLNHIVAALTTVWLPPYPQLLLFSLATSPSILTLSSGWFLYIAVSIWAMPAGQSCRSRLWERCVGNLIWSPQDLSEWSASVDASWTQASYGLGTHRAKLEGKVKPDRPHS